LIGEKMRLFRQNSLFVGICLSLAILGSCSQSEIKDNPTGPDTSSSSNDANSSSGNTNGSSSFQVQIRETHTYPKTDGPDKNPLKGWNSGWWVDKEIASVGFQYIPWKDFEPVDDQFDFAAVEEIIARPGSRGRHLILRLYADWQGDDASSFAPAWLYSDLGVARMFDSTGRYVTDYNDSNFLAEAKEAIQALGERYDDDPRSYAFELGVIGYWGEWHTFSFNGDFTLSDETKSFILNAYSESFTHAKLMGRYPWREPLSGATNIGYHNDFFRLVEHSHEFDQSILDQSKWLNGPIGGEMPPSIVQSEQDKRFQTSAGLDVIRKGHYSTMKPQDWPCEENSANCQGFMQMHKLMGYNYQIERAEFATEISKQEELSIDIRGTNIGVAPMYYPWEVQLALLQADTIAALSKVETDLRDIADSSSFTWSATLDPTNLAADSYTLGIRIIQPGADLPKPTNWNLDARNTYILFANDLDTISGTWSADHSLTGGWSILGNVQLNNP